MYGRKSWKEIWFWKSLVDTSLQIGYHQVMAVLYIMVGPAGTGKSTYAEKLVRDGLVEYIVSSDAIRKELYGSEEEQSGAAEVFRLVEQRVRDGLAKGHNVALDATNLTRKTRSKYIQIAKDNKALVHAICVDVPIKKAKERNAARDRKVPEWVIEDQYSKLKFPSKEEGVNILTWIRA